MGPLRLKGPVEPQRALGGPPKMGPVRYGMYSCPEPVAGLHLLSAMIQDSGYDDVYLTCP